MSDTPKPTLEQCRQIARYSWPSEWTCDTADVPAVLVAELDRVMAANADLERRLRAAEHEIEIVRRAKDVVAESRERERIRAEKAKTENAALRKDAERWRLFCHLWWISTEMCLRQDEEGTWSIQQVEDVEGEVFPLLRWR